MDLTQLKYFRTVAKMGNVSKAAEKLYVTQPNLSKSIARLEEELKVPLFEHRKGKIVLNEYGRVFLSSVELVFHELENGRQTILRMYENDQHVLRLGSCVDDFMADVLHDFPAQHPEVGLRLFSCAFDRVPELLLDHTADLILTNTPPANENIRYLELGRMEYVLLMNKKHPLAGQKGVHLAELKEEKFICDAARMNMARLQSLCKAQGFEPKVEYEVEGSSLIYRLLELNSGVAFVPVVQFLKICRTIPGAEEGLCMARIIDDIPKASMGLAHHRGFAFTYAADCLRRWVQSFLDEESRELEKFLQEHNLV